MPARRDSACVRHSPDQARAGRPRWPRHAYETKEDDRANADATGAAHGKATRSIPAPILYLVTARQLIQAHDLRLCRLLQRSSPQLRQLRQRREPAIGGQLVDKPWQNLRQLSDEFFLREA